MEIDETYSSQLSRKNRNLYDTLAQILAVSSDPMTRHEGLKLSWLMCKANLSYGDAKKHTAYLCERGLLALKDERYHTTEKGKEFLAGYSKIQSALCEEEAKKQRPCVRRRLFASVPSAKPSPAPS
jgi:predicted transcriptional regulator